MCFTYKLNKSAKAIEERFVAEVVHKQGNMFFEQPQGSFNGFIHPQMPVITSKEPNLIQFFEWGLIPYWAKDKNFQNNTLNARLENISEKPSFKGCINNRCLIPADGFFEWQWLDNKGKNKQKYLLDFPNHEIFAFAGLWSTWKDKQTGILLNTFSIITTEANELLSIIHNSKKRMPVIIKKDNEKDWLNEGRIVLWNDDLIATKI
ncbi:SOS response-associated peptidase [uncultured Bacteroides sp.]|uniref:SOS response-associated peptidase n=1 Tax=uncultured Bacteroides sp. TaxID=162156 RepID=UPI002AA8F5BC|nr:SOS response-associated peptidase [uncultured Bacteroides sp.]